MRLRRTFLIALMSLIITADAFGGNIRVLILNDIYDRIPSKNEKIYRLGSLRGDLLLTGTRYSGNIDVWRGESSLYIVNELPLEEYIKDVVAVEVSPDWDMEALKTQAVVSRTYALYQKMMNQTSIYHIASSVIHQLYKGNNPDVRVSYAIEQTSGEILTIAGKPIESFYHSTCGGKTENPEDVFGRSYPYLPSVESDCDLSPYSVWGRNIPYEEIEKAMGITYMTGIEIKSYTSTNRVKQVNIRHAAGTLSVKATDFRKALGWSRLPSTDFRVLSSDNPVVLEGKGYGHGVGLCQWGALQMARDGKTYRDILSFFYPGTVIQKYEDR
jgi:stage II sporulation protein D